MADRASGEVALNSVQPFWTERVLARGITSAFALLRRLPGGDRNKDIEILSSRYQLAVLQRQFAGQQVRFEPVDRAWLAALLHPLPRPTLRRLRLLVRPDTILKWHRDLIAGRHAAPRSRPRRRGRPRMLRLTTWVATARLWLHPPVGESREATSRPALSAT